jgi:hypothetical protein
MKLYPNKKSRVIILDEIKEAERILNTNPEKYITHNTLLVLAKYFFSRGLKRKDVKKELIAYCKKQPDFNFVLREKSILSALKEAKQYNIRTSNYLIPITKKELKKIIHLSHGEYAVAVYILLMSKLFKLEHANKNTQGKTENYSAYFPYDLKTAVFNVRNETFSQKNSYMSNADELKLLRKFYLAGIVKPTLRKKKLIVTCLDLNIDKDNYAFSVDVSQPITNQIIYYCEKCEKQIEKLKNRNLCNECYKEKRKKSEH